MSTYTIEKAARGYIIRGDIPVSDLKAITDDAASHQFDIADAHISAHLGATMVLTSSAISRVWRAELGIKKQAAEQRSEKLKAMYAASFAAHEIRERGEGWYLLQRREGEYWHSEFWTKVVVGAQTSRPSLMTVFGDYEPTTFGNYSGPPSRIYHWMGRSNSLDYYVRQKASIGTDRDSAVSWDNGVALEGIADLIIQRREELIDEDEDPRNDATLAELWELTNSLDNQGEFDAARWALGHVEQEDLFEVGVVTSNRVYIAHAALGRLCDLLDSEEKASIHTSFSTEPMASISTDDALVGEQSEVPEAACLHTQFEIEADVLSGRSCAEEQADGNGPCGACQNCLRARIKDIEAASNLLQVGLAHSESRCQAMREELNAERTAPYSNSRIVDAYDKGVQAGRAQFLTSTWEHPEFWLASFDDDFDVSEEGTTREEAIDLALGSASSYDKTLYVARASWTDPAKLMPTAHAVLAVMEERKAEFAEPVSLYINKEQRVELTQMLASWARRSVGKRFWESGAGEEIALKWCDECEEICSGPYAACECVPL